MKITLGELQKFIGSHNYESAYEVGQKYLFRCITFFYTGRVARETPGELVLADAAWIADTGRFYDSLQSGEFSEVEPFTSPVIIPKSTIVDASVWKHELPTEQK